MTLVTRECRIWWGFLEEDKIVPVGAGRVVVFNGMYWSDWCGTGGEHRGALRSLCVKPIPRVKSVEKQPELEEEEEEEGGAFLVPTPVSLLQALQVARQFLLQQATGLSSPSSNEGKQPAVQVSPKDVEVSPVTPSREGLGQHKPQSPP